MVASIPMAIEIVTTTTLAVGSKSLTKYGAIVTRLAAIEDMAGMAILCSDKTGTLTLNKMEIQVETPVYTPGETQYSLLRFAAMVSGCASFYVVCIKTTVSSLHRLPNGRSLLVTPWTR